MSIKGCPEEYPIILIVNGYEIATFQLTKHDLTDWAYGYLFSEGIIESPDEVESVNIDYNRGIINVKLGIQFEMEQLFNKKKHYTAGCGRGITFFSMTDVKMFNKIVSNQHFNLSYLLKKQSEFARNSPLYLETGGMHGACIVNDKDEMVIREDIGRHNAVDKIIGYAFRNRLDPSNLFMLTTGRISYEMLSKGAKFGFAVMGSRTAATKQAVQLAKYLNVEVVGYLRGKRAVPYTTFGRITNDVEDRKVISFNEVQHL